MTLFEQLKAIADKTVVSYMRDITFHDQKYLDAMKPRDLALWQCRPCGSHMVSVARPSDEWMPVNKLNPEGSLEFFEAVENTEPDRQWYLISKHYGADTVKKIGTPAARQLLRDQRFAKDRNYAA